MVRLFVLPLVERFTWPSFDEYLVRLFVLTPLVERFT
jgi:hypothetical protein